MELIAHTTIAADNGRISVDVVTVAGEGVRVDVQAHCTGYAPGMVHSETIVPIEDTVSTLALVLSSIDSRYIHNMLSNIERVTLGRMRNTDEATAALRSAALSTVCRRFATVHPDDHLYNHI